MRMSKWGNPGMWPSKERVLRKEFIMSNARERSSKIRNKKNTFEISIWYWKLAGTSLAE